MRLRRPHTARNIQTRALLDTFFVCSIATILIIRLQLWATNYPKLGGGKLHIAHLLWGGLAMLVAIVALLTFLGQARRHTAAILGGIGFGFFIDEIGKFVTSDNDYFFKPAAGIIYIVFIVMFLAFRELGWRYRWTPQDCVANAMQILSEAGYRQLHDRDFTLVRELLGRCDVNDPLVRPLSELLERLKSAPAPPPGRSARLMRRLRESYLAAAETPGFATGLLAVFILVSAGTLVQVTLDGVGIYEGSQPLRVISVAAMVFSVVASAFMLVGVYMLRSSRLEAYRWLDRGLLVQVFFTEVFAFLEDQFAAVFGLLFYMALLLALRTMMHVEAHSSPFGDDPLDPLAGAADPLDPLAAVPGPAVLRAASPRPT